MLLIFPAKIHKKGKYADIHLINIDYSLIHDGLLSIELINLFGQKVGVVLHNQFQSKGNHHVQMPISALNSGTYFLIISFDNNKTTRKIVIK